MKRALALLIIVLLSATSSFAVTSKRVDFVAEVWADNWFELYVNGKLVGRDSVSINTERSFNGERIEFSATFPLTIGIIAKDYVEDKSGLEYVGTSRQQIGDGGIIFQIRELRSNRVVTYSSSSWRALVLNKAPLNSDCVSSYSPSIDCRAMNRIAPPSWYDYKFDASRWAKASTFSESEVGVKEGYFDFQWDSRARLIWASNLKLDNTILLRKIVNSPK